MFVSYSLLGKHSGFLRLSWALPNYIFYSFGENSLSGQEPPVLTSVVTCENLKFKKKKSSVWWQDNSILFSSLQCGKGWFKLSLKVIGDILYLKYVFSVISIVLLSCRSDSFFSDSLTIISLFCFVYNWLDVWISSGTRLFSCVPLVQILLKTWNSWFNKSLIKFKTF